MLGELLQEDNVLSLLGVVADDGNQSIAHLLELELGLGVEEREGSEIDGGAGVFRVNYDGVRSGNDLAVIADTDVAEKVLRVLQVGFLLRSAQSLSSLSLILIATLLLTLLCESSRLFSLLVCDALSLGLLVCLLFCVCLCLLFCCNLCLLGLNFGIFCGGPAL